MTPYIVSFESKEAFERVKDGLAAADKNLTRYRQAHGSDLYTLATDTATKQATKVLAAAKPVDVAGLVGCLDDLVKLQDAALSLEKRAAKISAYEDNAVKELCEKHGYGAVMDSAARQWFKLPTVPKGSCHTTYHCYSVVKSVTEEAKEALAKFWGK